MKKLSALLMLLLLLLPAVSLGEEGIRIVEFEDFRIAVSERDLLWLGEETGSSNILQLFPDYDEAAATHPNIIAAWTPEALPAFSDEQVPAFCSSLMQSGIQQLTAEGVVVTDAQLLRADWAADTGAITVLFTLDADVAALGLEMKMMVCMGCRYFSREGKGCYSFTVGCTTPEEAEMLFAYLDENLTMKE